jgi:predicted Fe-Mo cluster-binding NifX family protein
MKTAFAYWDNRIAPVFDTARAIHVVGMESGQIVSETQATLPDDVPAHKALRLAEMGINALVCGAISKAMGDLVAAYGIRVIPFVAGELREVIQAWLSGTLGRDAFAMPGCCARNRRLRQNTCIKRREETTMNGQGRGVRQTGGRGRSGQGQGRTGNSRAAGAISTCVCPKCGQSEPHERGVPCVQKQCPACGTFMTRQEQKPL